MRAYEHLVYEQRGPVTVITINRPERMNAIGPQTHRDLVDAWNRFRADDSALVGVLTGAGDRAFCAGGDLKAAMAGELAVDASPDAGVLGPSRWTDIYKPTIAAVNGVAYAGGLEWACWTDLAIADEHATFGVTCRLARRRRLSYRHPRDNSHRAHRRCRGGCVGFTAGRILPRRAR